jgi:hypothetical protein
VQALGIPAILAVVVFASAEDRLPESQHCAESEVILVL